MVHIVDLMENHHRCHLCLGFAPLRQEVNSTGGWVPRMHLQLSPDNRSVRAPSSVQVPMGVRLRFPTDPASFRATLGTPGAFRVRSAASTRSELHGESEVPGRQKGRGSMVRDEYLRHLASVPLFSNCTKGQLQEIGKVADEIVLPAGKVLARQGEVGVDLLILLDGSASVTRDGQRVATVTSGDVVGELAVISGRPRNATVVAETELSVLVLTRRGLDQLLDDIPGLAKHLLYEVTARLVEATPETAR